MRDWLNRFLPYASLLGLVIFLSIASPYFATPGNISSVIRQTSADLSREISPTTARMYPL